MVEHSPQILTSVEKAATAKLMAGFERPASRTGARQDETVGPRFLLAVG